MNIGTALHTDICHMSIEQIKEAYAVLEQIDKSDEIKRVAVEYRMGELALYLWRMGRLSESYES